MNYMDYLHVKATVKDIGGGIFRIIYTILKWTIITVIRLCRSVLYVISAIGFVLFGFMLPFGTYFGYTVVREMISGIYFFDTKNWGMFLFCFEVPFVFMVVRNITKPR